MKFIHAAWLSAVSAIMLASIAVPAHGGGGGCFNPTPGPDIIVADLSGTTLWGIEGSTAGYSFGTTSCNIGDTVVEFNRATNRHPIITQDLFRIKDGRFEHIGMAWAKHAFGAAIGNACCICENPGTNQLLGLGCSDPYGSSTNGDQDGLSGGAFGGLGPRSDVDPFTGAYPFPYTLQGVGGTSTFKRLQVNVNDLDPALNAGADYVAASHYVAPDDAEAGNHYNNVSWRELVVGDPQNDAWFLNFTGQTFQEQTPLQAWRHLDNTVELRTADVANDGRLQLAVNVIDNGDGTWRYEYALYNMNVARGLKSIAIPLHQARSMSAASFRDIHYHSGELIDSADWSFNRNLSALNWTTPAAGPGEQPNFVRWSTVYSYGFTTDAPPAPTDGNITIGLGEFALPPSVTISAPVPAAPPPFCYTDCAPPGKPNGVINFDDLLEVVNAITTQNLDCDVAPDNGNGTVGNGIVNFDDLVEVINTFGPCR